MRALFVTLVACGGATTSKPVAPPTATTTPAATQPVQPKCDHAPRRVVLFAIEATDAGSQAEAEAFSQQMTLSDPCLELRPASMTLADAKRAHNCGAEHPICMAVIGMQEAADVIVYGRAERTRGTVKVFVRAVDVARKQALAMAQKSLDASVDLGAVARETLVALLMPE